MIQQYNYKQKGEMKTKAVKMRLWEFGCALEGALCLPESLHNWL